MDLARLTSSKEENVLIPPRNCSAILPQDVASLNPLRV
jgi:hypothetical protein